MLMPRDIFDDRLRMSDPKKFSWEMAPCKGATLEDIDTKTLTDIANTTNGKFYRARNAEELREIYHEIDKLEKSKIEVQRYSRRYEDYQKYGLIALGALLLEILLRITIFRRIP